jgi:hypothetical protein
MVLFPIPVIGPIRNSCYKSATRCYRNSRSAIRCVDTSFRSAVECCFDCSGRVIKRSTTELATCVHLSFCQTN